MRHWTHRLRRSQFSVSVNLLLACALLVGFAPTAFAGEVPTITVPQPPPGVYREPDWKRDFVGYREVAFGWLSADGQTFWCIADRGEPISFLSILEGKVKRDPVFLELDMVTRSIVREVDLPDQGLWVANYGSGVQRVAYLPASDRLMGWKQAYKQVQHPSGDKERTYQKYDGWEMHAIALSDPDNPVTRAYPDDGQPKSIPDWEWCFSQDGQWVWRLVYQPGENQLRLEKLSTLTLETVDEIEPAWSPMPAASRGRDFFARVAWRIDEASEELWFGVLTKEDGSGRLHWLRFKLSDGSLAGRVKVSDDVGTHRRVSFSPDSKFLSAHAPVPTETYRDGPRRYWRLPEGTLDTEVRTYEGGLWGAGSVLVDDRYLIVSGSMSSSIDPRSERVVWRYDREQKAWSWPRKVVVPQGSAHRQYSADGSTFVAFNLIDGRRNRLAVYRFGDQERYDPELAEALSRQQALPPSPGPLPQAEHTIKVSPGGEEVAMDRRVLPVPEGQVLKAAVSADGKRVALWMMHPDLRPQDPKWYREPVDPALGVYEAVVINAETGEIIQEVRHPAGYKYSELSQHTQVKLSSDGRWLLIYYAKETGREISMEQPILGPCRLQVVDTENGKVVADRGLPNEYRSQHRIIMLDQGILLRSFGMARPVVTGFEFCKLPSLETEANLEWTWSYPELGDDPKKPIVDDVRYDPGQSRFIALMREAGGLYNGRQTQTNQWVQYFDAQTMRPMGRGPMFYTQHGASGARMHNGLIRVNYDPPGQGNLIDVYRYDSDRPMLRIDGSGYKDGMFGGFVCSGPWLALRPGTQVGGKPGIVLINAETRQVLGPLIQRSPHSILWISPDGRRILTRIDRFYLSKAERENAPSLEWLTVRQ